MLDLSRIQGAPVVVEYAIDPTFTADESGLAMVRGVDAAGLEVIKPAAGTGTESFLGCLALDKHAAVKGTRVRYALQVPATGTQAVSLPDSLGLGTIKVESLDPVTGAYTAATVTTHYTVAGNIVTFTGAGYTFLAGTAADAAVKIAYISYNYTLTDFQKMQLGVSPVPSASAFIRKSAVLQGRVRVYVTNFVANDAYAVDNDVKLVANGFFGTSGAGNVVGKVVKTATALDPFLGIEYTV